MALAKTGTVGQSILPTPRGHTISASGLTDSNYLAGQTAASVVIPAGRCFLFAFAKAGAVSQPLASRSSASGNPICSLSVGSNGAGGTAGRFNPITRDDASSLAFDVNASGPIVDDGAFHLLVIQRTSSAWQLSMDGSTMTNFSNDATNAQGAITLTADRIAYGSDIVNGAIGTNAATVAVGGLVTGIDATPFLKDMAANPWMFFRPLKRRIYVNVAAAGGGFQAAWAARNNVVLGAGVH